MSAPNETWKRFHEKDLTHSMAHYLQAIRAAAKGAGGASVSDVAERLGVSKAGVTSMLRTLVSRGMVEHEPYGDVRLTLEGRRLAARTSRSRDVLTQFFGDILELPASAAEEDACMIEHLVSPDSMVQFLRLTAFLRSAHPDAVRFRAAFRAYTENCETGTAGPGCPVCEGTCLRNTFDQIDEPEGAPGDTGKTPPGGGGAVSS